MPASKDWMRSKSTSVWVSDTRAFARNTNFSGCSSLAHAFSDIVTRNCAKSGRQCEGYEHFPVFLNRTLEGSSRRQPLEEAKEAPIYPKRRSPGPLTCLSDARAWQSQAIAWFLDSYTPSIITTEQTIGTSVWLYHAIAVPSPLPVLKEALLALAITRYGRVRDQHDVINFGQARYGHALRLLQQALYDPVLMWNDQTLAAVRALVLYEVRMEAVLRDQSLANTLTTQYFESTSNDPTAWFKHLSGMTTLLQSRGPDRSRSPLARAVLEDIRYALVILGVPRHLALDADVQKMLKALMLRKPSLFGEDGWIETPWQHRMKSSDQRVYDQGFYLAAILDRADQLFEIPFNDRSRGETLDLLEACNNLAVNLEDLFDNSFKASLQSRSSSTHPTSSTAGAPNSLSTKEANQVMVVLNLWAQQVLLGWVAEALSSTVTDAISRRLVHPVDIDHATTLCTTSSTFANPTALDDLAMAILRYMPLCVVDGASEFAASRTLFPMTCVLWQFRHSPAHFHQALALMKHVSEARNVRFAQGGHNVVERIPFIARGDIGLLARKAGS